MSFLTPEQIAKILQINKMTVYREIKRGKLKAYKFGKELRISNIDFEAYLNNAYQAAKESMVSQNSCITPAKTKAVKKRKTTKQTTSKKAVNKKTITRKTKSNKRSK